MIGEAIKTLLAGVTSNVSPSFVAQTKSMPWIVYQEVSRDPLNLKDGGGSFDTVSMSIDIHHTTATLCDTMARDVRDALDYYSGTTDDVVIESCYFDNEQDLYEPDAEIYRRVQDYTFIVKDTTGYFGLVDFQNDCYIDWNGYPLVGGAIKNLKVTWKQYNDSYSTATQGILDFVQSVSPSNNHLHVSFEKVGTDKCYVINAADGTTNIYILEAMASSSYLGRVYDCELIIGDGTIVSFKIDGVTQSVSSTGAYSPLSTSEEIGRGAKVNSRLMKLGTIWDFKFYNKDTLVQLHEFPGHPSGNTDGAWDDTIGSLQATFTTVSGTPGTRDIIL